jgi:hypothetical protein
MLGEWGSNILFWLLPAGFFLAVIAFEIWESEIRSRLIPKVEMDRICGDLIAKYGYEGAISRAASELSRAHYTCDSSEIGKWKRVHRKLLGRDQEILRDKSNVIQLVHKQPLQCDPSSSWPRGPSH